LGGPSYLGTALRRRHVLKRKGKKASPCNCERVTLLGERHRFAKKWEESFPTVERVEKEP